MRVLGLGFAAGFDFCFDARNTEKSVVVLFQCCVVPAFFV
jgi:hypothetical protein